MEQNLDQKEPDKVDKKRAEEIKTNKETIKKMSPEQMEEFGKYIDKMSREPLQMAVEEMSGIRHSYTDKKKDIISVMMSMLFLSKILDNYVRTSLQSEQIQKKSIGNQNPYDYVQAMVNLVMFSMQNTPDKDNKKREEGGEKKAKG